MDSHRAGIASCLILLGPRYRDKDGAPLQLGADDTLALIGVVREFVRRFLKRVIGLLRPEPLKTGFPFSPPDQGLYTPTRLSARQISSSHVAPLPDPGGLRFSGCGAPARLRGGDGEERGGAAACGVRHAGGPRAERGPWRDLARPCRSRIRHQAAAGSWTMPRQWEIQRTWLNSARAAVRSPAKPNGV